MKSDSAAGLTRTAHLDTFARDRLPPRAAWPELRFDLDCLRYPVRLNAAAMLLDDTAAAGHADRPALHTLVDHQLVSCTYRQLQARVNQIARVLTEDLRLVPGNRVLLRGANNPMMAACWLAIAKAGLIAVATMPMLRAKELEQVAAKAHCQAALCDVVLADELAFCTTVGHPHFCPSLTQTLLFNTLQPGQLEDRLAKKPAQFTACGTAADDVVLIAFTSGTTGQPKGTMHFHRDVIAMCDAFPRSILQSGPTDIFCGTPPLAFTFGLGGMLAFPLRVGASTMLVEKLTPDSLLSVIDQARATICFTAPTSYRQMAGLAKNHDLGSLKKCISAGEALPDATRQLFKSATGIELIDGIGATEMIHIFISHTPARVRQGATGYVIPGYQACILDDDFEPCPPGVVGKLAVKGPTGCRYLDDPRQATYVPPTAHGWNLTGDAYKMDEDGYFYYQARTDDMIVSAGYNIAGPEVEAALLQHEAVAECGVTGAPDQDRGQIVKAFVVLKPGFTGDAALTAALQSFVKATIAPYKYPRVISYVMSLPRTETGKLQRFKLRDL